MATETATATATANGRASQLRIHLISKSDDLQLPPGTGPILVSTDLRRYQLSTLVNRLLETEQAIPLEFLVNGQFLRTSLDEFLTQNGISAETTLSVEYVKALLPPLNVTSYEHDDWVSSVDVRSSSRFSDLSSSDNRIISGSYDGILRVWNLSSQVSAEGSSHSASVKSARWVSANQIASSGVDRTVRLWKYAENDGSDATLSPTLELYGHTASVDGLSAHKQSSRILSASADGTVGFWSTKKTDAPAAPENLLATANKRRKISSSGKPTPQRGPLSLLKGHTAQVSSVTFDENDPTVAYSASWDHNVKTWDLTTSSCVDTRTTAQSLFSLCHLPEASLLATGTAARHITLVDPRASATSITAMTLRGHTNAVVSVERDPASSYRLVSGSHDGTCRVWDIRSVRNEAADRIGEAVYVINRESAEGAKKRSNVSGDGFKVFDVCWDRDVGIVAGGEDKKLQINTTESSQSH
ncbi:putative microtubule associated protein [Polychaeton citri CBS 116435]|uniref:Ribosome biogenesis protein YTM1 n=1 Tax=Polychaeton citri CBS 116435 TaxID=1314669 RepID=A0A9P4QE21_9PEZI|nr:putative microtubule associated protein [Polychaeton citri CBS 116435]